MIVQMGFPKFPLGINKTKGMCNEVDSTNPAHNSAAYSISKDTMLTVGAPQVNS